MFKSICAFIILSFVIEMDLNGMCSILLENMNYQNGKIYQLLCLSTNERYIGSCTTTLVKRMYNHKHKSNSCASKQIIDRGNYEITLLEDFSCDRKDQLTARERFYYDLLPNINRQRPMILVSDKETIYEETKRYLLLNKERLTQARKVYHANHREERKKYELENGEKIAEYKKRYRLENKVKIAEYMKRYRLDNKVKIAEQNKRYRLENVPKSGIVTG